jgi:hypothetical protein
MGIENVIDTERILRCRGFGVFCRIQLQMAR